MARLHKLKALFDTLSDPTRQHAANAAWSEGWGYFIGGHHVAIHRKLSTGKPAGARVAIVTGTGKDWQ